MVSKSEIIDAIQSASNPEMFRELHWTGTFGQYLDLIIEKPAVLRNAHQRLFDMILKYGSEEVTIAKEKMSRYAFFSDPLGNGKDAIFGLEKSLATLVDHFKAAAHGYGSERRVLLLHGPVGSSKSTIVRLIKKGLEQYSRTEEGALYTFSWRVEEDGEEVIVPSPMHEEPLLLLPHATREQIIERINASWDADYKLRVEGEPSPVSRYYFEE